MKSLRELLRNLSFDSSPSPEPLPRALFTAWETIVGADLARRSIPVRRGENTLFIAVPTVADLDLFTSIHRQILDRIQRLFPQYPIHHLHFLIDAEPFLDASAPSTPSPGQPLPPPVESHLQSMTDSIRDPILRRRLIRFYRRVWRHTHPSLSPEMPEDQSDD